MAWLTLGRPSSIIVTVTINRFQVSIFRPSRSHSLSKHIWTLIAATVRPISQSRPRPRFVPRLSAIVFVSPPRAKPPPPVARLGLSNLGPPPHRKQVAASCKSCRRAPRLV